MTKCVGVQTGRLFAVVVSGRGERTGDARARNMQQILALDIVSDAYAVEIGKGGGNNMRDFGNSM